ncbi:MAG: zf-HC2 domain-containing protein [Bacteroidota bacterium]
MTHEEAQMHSSAYVDGEVSGLDAAAMFGHLAECGTCRTFMSRVLAMRSTLLSAPPIPVPPALDRRVLSLRLPQTRSTPVRRLLASRIQIPLAAAAAIAVTLLTITLFSVSLWLSAPPQQPQKQETVYIMSLPAIEVHAPQPADRKPVQ